MISQNVCQSSQTILKRPRLMVLIALLIMAVPISIGVLGFGWPMYRMANQVRETRHRLLNQVDHQAIRAASRTLLSKYRETSLFPDDERLPDAIRITSPKYVNVNVDYEGVQIEYGGGFHHQGFIVLPDDRQPPRKKSGYQKLMDGLWFYEDTD
jgi:hypothetical protein